MRFVLVSFVFLGWAFFELSGGTGFEPRGVRSPQLATTSQTTPDTSRPATTAQPVEVSSLVAKSAIAPRKARPAETASAVDSQVAARTPAQVRISLSQGMSLFPASEPGTGAALASQDGEVLSLAQIAAQSSFDRPTAPSVRQPAVRSEPDSDIREVTGTRVNMRDGPGTIYPVISRLNIGQEVEVLSASGTGWLRLRTVQGQQVGWASASLIGKDAR